jgi:hypothetical protein
MFTSKGLELRDMGQKVLWTERRSRRGRPRREVNNGLRALFLDMVDAHGVGRRW